ncbi:MAG: hypothetical protein U5L04_13035 [Trueperaceae bacterium]|nr:hypothetical protein [Trueperaceae bacterium]
MPRNQSLKVDFYRELLFEDIRKKIALLSGTDRMIAGDFLQNTYLIEDGIDAQIAWLEELSADVEDMLLEMHGGL